MEFESTNSGTTAKLPILKLDSIRRNGIQLLQIQCLQYPDAKSMFVAIETRFRGNEATRKTQKTLLKQQYENFSATSAKSLDSIFNRLQKIVSKLAILGVVIAQEDLNSKFLSSLPPEWNTHVVVKKYVGASSGVQNLAFMTAPSTSSTNDANTASPQVSTASPNVNTASPQDIEQIIKDDLEVPPPYPLIYNRPKKLDLSYSGLDEFKEPEFKGYGTENSKQESNIVCDKKLDNSKKKALMTLFVKIIITKDTSSFVESSLNIDKETIFPVDKKGESKELEWTEDSNQTKKREVIFCEFNNKACFTCGSFNHVQAQCKYHQREGMGKPQQDDTGLDEHRRYFLKIPRFPRKDNMYSFDMKNIVPKESLTCLVAKATLDESMLWHRRLGHINFKNINKLVKDNLVRGLPTKRFENDQTCVACLKGKQHRASCKSKVLNPITKPLFMLHMDLFGPTFVSSLMHKKYCLVVTDDYSRFTWVFFLTTKDETSEILKRFIKEIENLVDKKVKIIRSDNGTEFKNKVMDDFCREKGIKREYSVARTPQQNGVAERRNRTLIEAARTMLADSKLPTTFWAEAVSTACYVQNRVLVVKPHNKTPYELFRGFKPALSFMRPFGCHVTILNTLDSLGKFDGKSDEGFFVGYSLSSKAFRVYNTRTKRVEENLHIGFLENKPMIKGTGPKWLFNIDSLTQSMHYVPVSAGIVSNISAGTSEDNSQECIVMPIWKDPSYFDSPIENVENGKPNTTDDTQKQDEDGLNNENAEQERFSVDSSSKDVNDVGQQVNTASLDLNTGSLELNDVGPSVSTASPNEEDNTEEKPKVDLGNITNFYIVLTTPNTRIHKDHLIDNVIGDVQSTIQIRRMLKPTSEQGFL
ncbi:putative ribonuclease H-like domain-containing protein, partial [Tanacetum coccineum]